MRWAATPSQIAAVLLVALVASPLPAATFDKEDFIKRCMAKPERPNSYANCSASAEDLASWYKENDGKPSAYISPEEAEYNMAIFNAKMSADTAAEQASRPYQGIEPFNPGIEYYHARFGSGRP